MITVAMSVHNSDRWLRDSLSSILNQTFRDFELLIIDDGSTDSSPSIIAEFAERDDRVRVISQENQGIVPTLNRSLHEARFDWVARLDDDDLAYPERLGQQWDFVQQHPGVVAVGSYADYINEHGEVIGSTRNPFISRDRVERQLAAGQLVYFVHSSVIARRDVLLDLGGYRDQFPLSHDTDMWNRVAEQEYPILAQPEILTAYRIHQRGTSRSDQRRLAEELRWVQFCAQQRRRGRPEPSRHQFRAAVSNAPRIQRLALWRKDRAFIAYKAATLSRARGEFVKMIGNLAVAIALDPFPTISTVWHRARRSFPGRD